MQLAQALGIHKGDLVAFVGAGGKSSAMQRLAAELAEKGWRVAVTTTTRIRASEGASYPRLIVGQGLPPLIQEARDAFEAGVGPVALARERLSAQGKLAGLPEPWPQALLEVADAVLVEADGARGRSLKAPAPHEPAIPAGATLVVSLIGLDALGEPVGSPWVHRPERVGALLHASPDMTLGPEEMAALIVHPEGQAKGVPDDARFIPLLNKADAPGRLEGGRQVACLLKREPRVEAAVLGALRGNDPFLERWEPVAAIVLAAGGSRRYGQPKQLLPLAGRPLLHHVLEAILAAPVEAVWVVLGAHAEHIKAALAPYKDDRRLGLVNNPHWRGGLSTSLRAGLDAARGRPAAALIALGDQPFVSQELIERLLLRRAQTLAPIVAPSFQGRRGNPVLFDASLFDELRAVTGDEGGRSVAERHQAEAELVDLPAERALWDVDTLEDYRRALAALEADEEQC